MCQLTLKNLRIQENIDGAQLPGILDPVAAELVIELHLLQTHYHVEMVFAEVKKTAVSLVVIFQFFPSTFRQQRLREPDAQNSFRKSRSCFRRKTTQHRCRNDHSLRTLSDRRS